MRFLNMKFLKLSVLVLVIVGQVSAIGRGRSTSTNNGSSSSNYGVGGTSSTTFGGGSSANYGGSNVFTSTGFGRTETSREISGGYGDNGVPRPYNFDYQSADEQGNTHYHKEEADASGTVRGSYGYNDVQGLYRVVDYIADANGYRASIRTNEPGIDGKESPADVQMYVDQPPFGIQDRYTSYGGTGGSILFESTPYGGTSGGGEKQSSGYQTAASGTFDTGLESEKPKEREDTYEKMRDEVVS